MIDLHPPEVDELVETVEVEVELGELPEALEQARASPAGSAATTRSAGPVPTVTPSADRRPARVVQHPDDAGGALVLRTLELEPVDQLGIGGGAGDAHAAGVGHVAEQRAEGDDHLAAGLLGDRHAPRRQNDCHRTLGSTPRSTTRSRSSNVTAKQSFAGHVIDRATPSTSSICGRCDW